MIQSVYYNESTSKYSACSSPEGNYTLKILFIAGLCLATTTLTIYFPLISRQAQTENEITGISKADSIERADQENRKRELELKQRELELKEKVLEVKMIDSQQKETNTTPQRYLGSNGIYTFASTTLLSANDLRGYSKWDLKIMRNEIFARHGYIFKTPEMKSYFARQNWYVPLYDNVDQLLSGTERKNIQLIKAFE